MSNLRLLCAENKVQSFPVDMYDVPPPPVGSKYFTSQNDQAYRDCADAEPGAVDRVCECDARVRAPAGSFRWV